MAVINTNLQALTTLNQREKGHSSLSTAMERLSSGLRVNSAKDDAAGQAIGNRMTAQIRGQHQAARNANDGVSLSQTAQGALSEVNDRLQRIRELTVQGLNGTLNLADSDAIQAEINLNLKEIDRLAKQSNYNGIPVLDGSAGKVGLQIGANDGETLDVDLAPPGFSVDELGLTDFNVAGLEGEVFDINSLPGQAINVILGDASTVVRYADAHTGTSMPADTKLMRQGAGSYFVQSLDVNGNPIHYLANKQAHSTTSTRSSTVDIGVHQHSYLKETDKVGGLRLSGSVEISYLNATGEALTTGNPTLVKGQEDGHYYVKMQENGEEFYYRATVSSARHEGTLNATPDSVTIQVDDPPQRLSTTNYDETLTEVGSVALGPDNVSYLDSSGKTFNDGASRSLIEANGSYYVQVTDGDDIRYHAADVTTAITTEKVRVTAEEQALTTRSFSDAAPYPNKVEKTDYFYQNGDRINTGALFKSDNEYFVKDVEADTYYKSTIIYYDENNKQVNPDTYTGNQLTAVVRASDTIARKAASFSEADATPVADSPAVPVTFAGKRVVEGEDGRHYVKHDNGTDPASYEPVTLLAARVSPNGSRSLSWSSEGPKRISAGFDTATQVTQLPELSVAASTTEVALPAGSELVVDENDRYYLRSLDNDSADFRYTEIFSEMQSDGTFSLDILDTGSSYRSLDDVITVTGTSTVSLDPLAPPNVEVRYIEASGTIHEDVLGKDANGNYIMRVSNGGENNYKTATLVELQELEGHYLSEDAQYLIKTRNGNGDVIIYQAMQFEAITNAGEDHTQVVLTETGKEIRLRQPRDPLAALDRAIARVDEKRSTLGATENRLGSAIDTLATSSTNLTAAQSRIVDADYAVEVSNMTKAQILQQASNTMLAQANQVPQTVLSLLR